MVADGSAAPLLRDEVPDEASPSRVAAFWRDAGWLALYVPLTLAYTWPLAARLNTHLSGDDGDSWQNLWNLVWLRRSLWTGRDPFFTTDLWHPDGATLAFQTFDLPDLVPAALLVGPLAPWTVYNMTVLWTFVASGATMYLLSRACGASRPASFLSGCAYTFATYHFAHALGHLHLLAMQWVPLYVLCLLRMLDTGRLRWALGGAVMLVMASLSSWYYLAGCFFITAPLFLGRLWRARTEALRLIKAAATLCGTYLLLVGPLGFRMLRERGREPFEGAHEPDVFSADLQMFFAPNWAQRLSAFSDLHLSWTGNEAENGAYLGLVLVGLCVAGMLLKAPRTRAWGGVALVGLALSLGPRLHVGGEVVTGAVLPYAWLETVFPLVSFMGAPVRFAFVATFALAAALAPSLDALSRRVGWWAVAPLAVVALAEHAPKTLQTRPVVVPEVLRQWAASPERFAVLDASGRLLHQAVHGKPILGGYLTRTPVRLVDKLLGDPVLSVLLGRPAVEQQVALHLPEVNFPEGRPMVPGAESDRFSLQVQGPFRATTAGHFTFTVASDDGAELFINGERVVDNRGEHPMREASGTVWLEAGDHQLALHYEQLGGAHGLVAWWSLADGDRRLLDAGVLPEGLAGVAYARMKGFALAPEKALGRLQELDIRYIVHPDSAPRFAVEEQLGLEPLAEEHGLRFYEVPR